VPLLYDASLLLIDAPVMALMVVALLVAVYYIYIYIIAVLCIYLIDTLN
jgi:hypothetical protein